MTGLKWKRSIINLSLGAPLLMGMVLAAGPVWAADQWRNNDKTVNSGTTTDIDVIGGRPISDSVPNPDIYGVSYNKVTVNGGNIGDPSQPLGGLNVYGGQVTFTNHSVHHNEVYINGGRVVRTNPGPGTSYGGNVFGGYASGSRTVYSNKVFVNNDAQVDGSVTGGFSLNTVAYYNEVEIGGQVPANSPDIGGSVIGGESSQAEAYWNKVRVQGGTVTDEVIGGLSNVQAARENTVIIDGGQINGQVIGGRSIQGQALRNTVTINGGLISGDVAGGYSVNGSATGNTVILSGGDVRGRVFGGYSGGGGPGDFFTGNRLSVKGYHGSVAGISNFEYYDFYLPASLANGQTLIHITGAQATDLTGAKVDNITIDENSPLLKGDKVTLIDKVEGSFTAATMRAAKGPSLFYDVNVHKDGQLLNVSLLSDSDPNDPGNPNPGNNGRSNPQAKSLNQSALAGTIHLNRGADLLVNNGPDLAETAAVMKGSDGPAFFSGFTYGDTRTKTGSHIDADGWSGLFGLAWKPSAYDDSGWLMAAFAEAGKGDYSGYNSFSSQGVDSVKSWGDTKYWGGGLMARYRFESRLRLEGSLRFGRVESNFRAKGYIGAIQPEYDLNSNYYGAHLGVGYDSDLCERLNLDLTAKYLWTRQEGQTVRILGDKIEFDDVDSQRARAGGRLTYAATPSVKPFVGVYGEYEFDGKARSRNRTENIRHQDLKTRGATGIGELGLSIAPTQSRSFNIDLSVQGYTGRREGVGGSLTLGWTF